MQSFYLSQGIATIGISVLTKQFKIGSWNQLSLLWIYYILECGGGMEWTSCAGNYHPRGCLKLDPFIKSYHPLLMSFSWKTVEMTTWFLLGTICMKIYVNTILIGETIIKILPELVETTENKIISSTTNKI